MNDRALLWAEQSARLDEAAHARVRVIAALEDILKFDTDRDFVLKARARYLELTSPPTAATEITEPAPVICMRHTNIRPGS